MFEAQESNWGPLDRVHHFLYCAVMLGRLRHLSPEHVQKPQHPSAPEHVHIGGLIARDTSGSFVNIHQNQPPAHRYPWPWRSWGLFEVEHAGRQELSAPADLLMSCDPHQLVRLLLSSMLCPRNQRAPLLCKKSTRSYTPLQAMPYILRFKLWDCEGIPIILYKKSQGDGVG